MQIIKTTNYYAVLTLLLALLTSQTAIASTYNAPDCSCVPPSDSSCSCDSTNYTITFLDSVAIHARCTGDSADLVHINVSGLKNASTCMPTIAEDIFSDVAKAYRTCTDGSLFGDFSGNDITISITCYD